MKLSSIIFENRFDQQAKKLEGELQASHKNQNIRVSMGYYAEDGPKASKGYGKVTFVQNEPVDPTEWKNLKNKLFIPKETYHRLIKGTGDLTLKIYKLWLKVL